MKCKGIVANQATKESPFCVHDSSVMPKSRNLLPTSSKKKNKKGGLSMFLSGALDVTAKDVAPTPTPKSEGPAWGGAKISKDRTSLRDIQDEQSKIKVNQPGRSKDQLELFSDGKSDGKILLSSFLPSTPIPVVSVHTSQPSDGETSTPPWAASITPPHLSRPSLRDIQKQQQV